MSPERARTLSEAIVVVSGSLVTFQFRGCSPPILPDAAGGNIWSCILRAASSGLFDVCKASATAESSGDFGRFVLTFDASTNLDAALFTAAEAW